MTNIIHNTQDSTVLFITILRTAKSAVQVNNTTEYETVYPLHRWSSTVLEKCV